MGLCHEYKQLHTMDIGSSKEGASGKFGCGDGSFGYGNGGRGKFFSLDG